jgi:chromosome segregation ATPase
MRNKRMNLRGGMIMDSISSGWSSYASNPYSSTNAQPSEYSNYNSYWNYDKQRQLDMTNAELEKVKYAAAGVYEKVTNNQSRMDELAKQRDALKYEISQMVSQQHQASDQKAHYEGKRYDVTEKERWASGNDLHHLCREKEQLNTEIARLNDVITGLEWKINEKNSQLQSACSSLESLSNENYYLKDQYSNMNYKYKELASLKESLEREKGSA